METDAVQDRARERIARIGFFDALQLYLQTIPSNPIPSDFIQMIPYLAILIILAVTSRKMKYFGVTAGGKPYTKYASSH